LQNRHIVLALLAFLTIMPISVRAETVRTPQKKEQPPANLSDAALASYISGRLTPLLKDTGYQVSQSCDADGCAVVVQ
jgi:hypothetical protein